MKCLNLQLNAKSFMIESRKWNEKHLYTEICKEQILFTMVAPQFLHEARVDNSKSGKKVLSKHSEPGNI